MFPGRKAGVVVIRDLTAGRYDATDFLILRASRRFVDCFGSADFQGMNANRAIKSNVGLLNIGTGAGGTWRRNAVLARGNGVQAATGGNPVAWYPVGTANCPKPTDPNLTVRAPRAIAM